MAVTLDPRLAVIAAAQPYPLFFATISGAHLYGFPSPDSDYDLRGAHILGVRDVIGLDRGPDTLEVSDVSDGLDLDLVTHDIGKFATLLLKRNGYVLEQLYSPLVVAGGELHDELKTVAAGCITRHHVHHYLGFADTQWAVFEKTGRLKPLLYTFRVLKTGIHLMRTGRVQADLTALLAENPHVPYLQDLVDQKRTGRERDPAPSDSSSRFEDDVSTLRDVLRQAYDDSPLPEAPTAGPALHDLVVRARLALE
jgi:hypothetical protein